MAKIIKIAKQVFRYIGAVVAMVGMMVACFAGGTEDMEAIKALLKVAAIIIGCSLPFWAISVTLEAIMVWLED